ncbi:hypothetical protein COL154_003253 [Colletotrichum chrysophilum]|nr:hypothetical protein COL154_003253 [Colletotrichum chrysophilum]
MEHDGSLSRNDVYFGDNHSFDEEIWETVASHFVNETISIPTAAKARAARLQAAAAANPEFSLTADGVQFSFIETALYLSIFGNLDDGNAKTEWVKVLFRKFNVMISWAIKADVLLQRKSACRSLRASLDLTLPSRLLEFLDLSARLLLPVYDR